MKVAIALALWLVSFLSVANGDFPAGTLTFAAGLILIFWAIDVHYSTKEKS